jgi:hypothetical protein
MEPHKQFRKLQKELLMKELGLGFGMIGYCKQLELMMGIVGMIELGLVQRLEFDKLMKPIQ